MKIDFHTHVKFAKKAQFSLDYFYNVVNDARDAGLTALTLTEHFNTEQWSRIYDALDNEFPYESDYYDVNGFRVFAGMEIDIQEHGHVLFTGHRDAVRAFHARLTPHMSRETYISMEQLFIMSQSFDFLKIGAHPFRESNPLFHLSEEILMQFDAFDLNGKDLYAGGIEVMKEKVYEFAAKLELPVVGGSDSHHPLQLGSIYNECRADCKTINDLRQMVRSQDYKVIISPDLSLKVKAATIVKNLLKENLELNSQILI